MSTRVEITYCTQCKFLLRAAWMAQELLTTFENELAAVTLRPGSGGIFEVRIDGEILISNLETKQLPDAGEVKRLVRERISPARRIGHD